MADGRERRSEADNSAANDEGGGVPAAVGTRAGGRGVIHGGPLPAGRPHPSSASFDVTAPSSALSLRRNPSVASSHSHSSGRSAAPPSSWRSSAAPAPASPALSTLSKNSSSGGSSYSSAAAAARMSLDDILRNTKSSRGARKRRRTVTVHRAGGSGARSVRPPLTTPSAIPLSSSSRPTSASVALAGPLNSGRRPRRPDEGGLTAPNLGQEERMRRLERMQMEKLRHERRSGLPPDRSRSSLEGPKAMSDDGTEGSPSGGGRLISSREGGPISILENSAKQPGTAEPNIGGGGYVEEGVRDEPKPTPRRSRRAKAVISYNAAESARTRIAPVANMMKTASLENSKSSPTMVVSTQTAVQFLREGSLSARSQNVKKEQEAAKEEEEEEEDKDAPESAASALAVLMSKYDACINGSSSTQGEDGVVVVSPWSAVQPLLSVLQHINLNDPDAAKSEECMIVERGLATIVASIERVKHDVMNRDSMQSPIYQENHSTGEERRAGKEARLLLIIQIQVWIRMMVWMLEHEVGWEFLTRVIKLSDAQSKSVVNVVENVERRKKDRKKKNKKKPKDKVGQTKPRNDFSPERKLVQEVRSLMELALFVLPPSVDASQWIRATLTFGFRQTVPKYGAELFHHFEIDATEPITLKRSGTDVSQQSRRSERSEVSHSPVKMPLGSGEAGKRGRSPMKQLAERRNERQRAYFASLAEQNAGAADDESATITGSVSTVTSASRNSRNSLREKDDALLFRTSLSLTSEYSGSSSNPFLKGTARGEYVGSHLGSKLSNITSLFREVKAPSRPKITPKPVAASKRKGLPEDRQGDSAIAGETIAAARQQSSPGSRGARTRLLRSSPPKETPRKRPHAAASSTSNTHVPQHALAESPRPTCAVAETPLLKGTIVKTPMPTVDETPTRQLLRVRPRTGGSILDSIVEETPQQPLLTRNGGPASSAVMPTNLWRAPSQPMQPRLSDAPVPRQREKLKGRGKVDLANGTGESHYGLSPMPHGEDVTIVSQAAKAAAARKRKKCLYSEKLA